MDRPKSNDFIKDLPSGYWHDIPKARFKLESNYSGEYRRLWILVMEFLTPYDIISIRRVSKLVYLVTFEQVVWRSVLRNYYLNIPYEYKFLNEKLSFSVINHCLIVKNLGYSFWSSENVRRASLFFLEGQELRLCEYVSFEKLIQIQDNYRDICYAIMALNCIGCKKYVYTNLYFQSWRGFLCGDCMNKPKYRVVTKVEACLENGISLSQFDSLNLDFENLGYPILFIQYFNYRHLNYRNHFYFDIIVKDRLNMLNKNLPIPPKTEFVEKTRKMLQDKQPKYINTRRHQYPQVIRNFKSPAFKHSKKAR